MAEPRFKKTMEERSEDKIEDWKKRETKPECPGGKRNCRDCKSANIISSEELLKGVS